MTHNNRHAQQEKLDNLQIRIRDVSVHAPIRHEWIVPKQFLAVNLLLYIGSGHGRLGVDGTFYELRKGGLYMAWAGELIEGRIDGIEEGGVYALTYEAGSWEGGQAPEAIRGRLSFFPIVREVMVLSPVVVARLCADIHRLWTSEAALQRLLANARLQELLYTLLHDGEHRQRADRSTAVEEVRNYMESRYTEKLSIEELAREANLSPRHFMRQFKRRFGCSAVDYLTYYRMNRAQALMRQHGHDRLRDIARQVGYSDELYFRRKFRQIVGLPPAAFMRNSKQKIVAVHRATIFCLLPLQIVPCAAPSSHPWTHYYSRKYTAAYVLPLAEEQEEQIEQLTRLAPDGLVVSDTLTDEASRRLRAIAPVHVIPPRTGHSWREQLRQLAASLGRAEIAERWLARYAQKAAQVRARFASVITADKLLVLRVHGRQLHVLGPDTIADVFFADLGMRAASGSERLWDGRAVTIAQLHALDATQWLVAVDQDEQAKTTWRQVMEQAEMRAYEARHPGRMLRLPPGVLLDDTALTRELLLDELWELWRDRP